MSVYEVDIVYEPRPSCANWSYVLVRDGRPVAGSNGLYFFTRERAIECAHQSARDHKRSQWAVGPIQGPCTVERVTLDAS